MKDLEHCRKLIEVVVGHTKLPVSVKIRSGIGSVTAVDFVKAVKGLPIAAIMIHGRAFEKPFIGSPDYAMIKKVKKEFSGIVLGNGGINTPQDAAVMLKKTGVDGLGLARGLYGQPWLFEQIKDFVLTEKFFDYNINSAKGFTAIKKAALRHAKYAYQTKGKWGMVEFRKHLCWYFRGFAGAADLRKRLVSVETVSDVEDILKSLKV
jgi:tRNA-dihydrouridine synthase